MFQQTFTAHSCSNALLFQCTVLLHSLIRLSAAAVVLLMHAPCSAATFLHSILRLSQFGFADLSSQCCTASSSKRVDLLVGKALCRTSASSFCTPWRQQPHCQSPLLCQQACQTLSRWLLKQCPAPYDTQVLHHCLQMLHSNSQTLVEVDPRPSQS